MTPTHAEAPPLSAQRPTGLRRVLRVLAAVGFTVIAVPVFARVFGVETGPLAILVALMPWVTLASLVPLLLAVLARAWWLVGATAVVVVNCVAWLVPLYVAEPAPAGGETFTVGSLNLTFGQTQADAVVQWVADEGLDVLSAQEVTPAAVAALEAAGLDEVMPYSQVAAEPGVTGTGLWSRLPLTDAETLAGFAGGDGYRSRAVQASLEMDGTVLTVIAVHPAAPGLWDNSGWRGAMADMAAFLAEREGPTLVVGDFNTTRDHQSFRELQDLGYIDAADQAGAGFAPTFPQGRGPFPVAAIDHALIRDAPLTATAMSTVVLPGADHRGIVVTYVTH